jgi:hypothetical protein
MKLNAILEDGRLSFETPVRLKRPRTEVVVDIPDAEIEAPELSESSRRLVARLDAIRNAPIPPEWDEEPSSKADRLDAFANYRKP